MESPGSAVSGGLRVAPWWRDVLLHTLAVTPNAVPEPASFALLFAALLGRLGGRAGVAPRPFLKKLVADVLDRVDQFPDFDPRRHYAPTLDEREMTPAERVTAAASSVDDVALEL